MRFDRSGIDNWKWQAAEWAKHTRQFAAESFGFTEDEAARILDEVHARGDRLMLPLLAAHGLLAAGQAFFYGTWLASAAVTAAALTAFLACRALRPRSFLTRAAAGVAPAGLSRPARRGRRAWLR